MIGGEIVRRIYRRRPILCKVTIAHGLFLLFLLFGSLLQARHRPRYEVIEVQFIDQPATPIAEPPSPAPETPPSDPGPETPPPEPAPEAPPPEPAPPAWKPRSVEDIRSQALRPRQPQPRPTPPSPVTPPQPAPRAEDIARQVRQQLSRQNLTVSIPESSRQASVSPTAANRYLAAVLTLLEREWQQPSSATVPAGQRRTTVALEIGADGSIRQARVSRPSGSAVMDQSVQAIFQRVRQLPPPRQYNIQADPFQVNVAFELE